MPCMLLLLLWLWLLWQLLLLLLLLLFLLLSLLKRRTCRRVIISCRRRHSQRNSLCTRPGNSLVFVTSLGRQRGKQLAVSLLPCRSRD